VAGEDREKRGETTFLDYHLLGERRFYTRGGGKGEGGGKKGELANCNCPRGGNEPVQHHQRGDNKKRTTAGGIRRRREGEYWRKTEG